MKKHISWNQQANDLMWWLEWTETEPEKLYTTPNLVLYPLPKIVKERLAIRVGRKKGNRK